MKEILQKFEIDPKIKMIHECGEDGCTFVKKEVYPDPSIICKEILNLIYKYKNDIPIQLYDEIIKLLEGD